MENNHIKQSRCCYFNEIITLEHFDIDNISIDEKSHGKILIHFISYKSFIVPKLLRTRFDKITEFISFY